MTDYGKGEISWFQQDRLGMFIHWGLYAMGARHEWLKNREKIKDEDYQIYFDLFNPDLFDPKDWARRAREAGMKYFVITTKHHEGFCLWDSKYTDYKAPNAPCGKDLLREVVDAFRAEGLKVGFYYSLIDWHHPDFTVDRLHPDREREEARAENSERDMTRYAEYMRNQVRELLTEFGRIDILWFDFSYPGDDGKGRDDWESEKMVSMIRELQPHIILNDRLDLPGVGDVKTPEQYVPDNGIRDENGKLVVWEGCQTFSGSWGYHRDESSWKSPAMLVRMLIDHVSRGGNLLLNVGPTARGIFDRRACDALEAMGDWMNYHGRAIYNCTAAPDWAVVPKDCRYTYNPETNRLYLHLYAWPFKHINLPGMRGRIKYSQFLHDTSEIIRREQAQGIHDALTIQNTADDVTIMLPTQKPDVIVPVVELFLKSK